MISVLFHTLMVVVDVGTVFVIWQFVIRQGRRFMSSMVCLLFAGTLAFIFSASLGEDIFGIIRLLSYGLFIHGPIIFGVSAVLLWRKARKTALVGDIAAVAIVTVGIDAFFIEPTWLEVTHIDLQSSKIREPLRIVVIADLQTDIVGPYERQVLQRALSEKPDLILLAGDYLQTYDRQRALQLRQELNELLVELDFHAPLGVYAVGGNVEIPQWQKIFAGLPVTVLDETGSLDLERDDLHLTALSLTDSRDRFLEVTPNGRFHICLGHCPDFSLGNVQADLLVAGHTHGGQIRLPWIGPIMTLSRVPRSWAAGLTQLDEGRLDEGRRLLVSRGIGLERGHAPRMRFLCRPELVVVNVRPR